MTGRSHLALGATAAVTGAALAGSTAATAAVVVGSAVASAKLPDIDRRIGLRHRGPTHTLVACALVAVAVAVGLSADGRTAAYAGAATAGALIGYAMHLVADACTPHGVPALAPFCRRDLHLLPHPLRIVTGSWQEMVVVALLVGVALYLAFGAYA